MSRTVPIVFVCLFVRTSRKRNSLYGALKSISTTTNNREKTCFTFAQAREKSTLHSLDDPVEKTDMSVSERNTFDPSVDFLEQNCYVSLSSRPRRRKCISPTVFAMQLAANLIFCLDESERKVLFFLSFDCFALTAFARRSQLTMTVQRDARISLTRHFLLLLEMTSQGHQWYFILLLGFM